jgi:SNF2 family DNA or RNA helicase
MGWTTLAQTKKKADNKSRPALKKFIGQIKKRSAKKKASRSKEELLYIVKDEPVKPQRWKPLPYMKKAVKWVVKNSAAGLFLDPGLRKTSITLASIVILLESNLITKVLVVAPRRVCYNVWPKEIRKWLDFNHLTYSILHGADKDKNFHADVNIQIINPEGLKWYFKKLKEERGNYPDMLVVDESTRFKNTNTQRFDALKPYLNKFVRRLILTGSPAPRNYIDLFGQMFILDGGRTLGSYITHFRNKFFNPTGYGGFAYELQEGADKQIQKLIKPYVLRLAREDYVKLPKLIDKDIVIDMPFDAYKIYQEIEEDFISELENGTITAANAGVKCQKLRQIAGGGCYYVDNKNRKQAEHIHNEKAEAVYDLVEELSGKPALIAYQFDHELERLFKLFKIKYDTAPLINSGTSDKKASFLENEWNRGNLPFLFAHPQSIAWGLNLQEAGNAVIWHSIPWDLEIYQQYIQRIHRPGVVGNVFNYHIMAKGTIDYAVKLAINKKARSQGDLLTALKSYYF